MTTTPSAMLAPAPALDTIRAPFSPHTEALTNLRQGLLLRADGEGCNVLTIASPGAGEGKSRFAAELAWLFALLGESTLLVDANLRKPMQQQLFTGAGTAPGLAEALADGSAPVLHKVQGAPQLSVALAGSPPRQPAELLGNKGFGQLLDGWRGQFRHIVLDTSGFTASSDALAVSVEAGAALLLARSHHSRVDDLRAAAARLRGARVSLLGTVMLGF